MSSPLLPSVAQLAPISATSMSLPKASVVLAMCVTLALFAAKRLRFALRSGAPQGPVSWRLFFRKDLRDDEKSRQQLLVEAAIELALAAVLALVVVKSIVGG